MTDMKPDLRLYAILDPVLAGGRPLPDLARMLARGGATLFQLRDKHGSTRTMIDEARAIKNAVAGSGVPLLINDRVDVALAANADGVHVGQSDMDAADARRLLGPGRIIGLTIKTIAQADAAPLDLIDYACIGGVFATTSKDNPDAPVGLDGFRVIRERFHTRDARFPVGAIAGIDTTNAADVAAAGADGVAIISALSLAPEPEAAAKILRAAFERGRAHQTKAGFA